jgi:hypothetical protein
MPVSFAFRFGLDSSFDAIGFKVVVVVVGGVVVVVVVVGVVVDAAPCLVVDLADVVVVDVVLPAPFAGVAFAVVGLTGLPAVVGLPEVVGLPVVVGFAVVAFPTLAGLCVVVGLLALPPPGPSASAGDTARDVATTTPKTVGENRIRIPPRQRSRKAGATPTVCFSAKNHLCF